MHLEMDENVTTHRIEVGDGVRLSVDVRGQGDAVVLLHGFPQTRLMWRHVAAELARDHTVVTLDLRGYGDSDAPAATSEDTYSKRTMAADVVAVADALGIERFTLAGHDRGALVAFRAGLDHPERVRGVAFLDVVPTVDSWEVLHGVSAAVAFHLFLMAQPAGLPEALIAGAPREFFGHFLDVWGSTAMPAEVREHYLRASAARIPSIVADFRASATVDLAHDTLDRSAGRRLSMPVSVLQQDWGAQLGYDVAGVWRAWADDLDHRTTGSSHFVAEESPAEVVSLVRDLTARVGVSART